MKTSTDEQLARRFHLLNTCVTVVLMAAIIISITNFGREAWIGAKQVGFIMTGSHNDHGWNRAKFRGINYVCNEFGYDLLLRENVPISGQEFQRTVEELADKGTKTIFLASSYHSDEVERLAMKYPRIQFHGIDVKPALDNIHKYSVRYIELRYLSGIIAGLHTKTNHIGYVAPFSCPEVNQGINAFALGVQSVNPKADILLVWTGDWDNPSNEQQAVHNLRALHADVLAYHQDGDVVPVAAERAGISFISFHESYPNYKFFLAGITANWSSIYQHIMSLQNNPSVWKNDDISWTGFTQGMADIEPAMEKLSPRERAVYESERWKLLSGKLIFAGEIFDRNNVKRCEAGESISSDYLQNQMDWLVKGVNIIGY
ncbi:MAG: BMP family ABC transporter substrate-binding protein [Selenomonadaceae bacterium]|nr:BMP family ABC transporter substrate-binding protein [Selenomonadaceae bacterium]